MRVVSRKIIIFASLKQQYDMLKVFLLAMLLTLSSSARADEDPSRGIGIYPGNPAECFAPTLVGDTTYRNLALHRRAWHSSSHDYNLTAQLGQNPRRVLHTLGFAY